MRLSIVAILSLATSSLAVALVPKNLNTSLISLGEPKGNGTGGGSDKDCKSSGGGNGGGKDSGDGKAEGSMKECKKFRIKAKGTAAGWVGQLSSGQLRIGLKAVEFSMESGQIVDCNKRGMWWTPPTDTLQCDVGQKPDKGWSAGCDGRMYFQDMSKYYQCEADNNTYNLYKKNGQAGKCGEVRLYMVGCGVGEDTDKGGDDGKGGGGMPSSPSNGTQTPPSNGTKIATNGFVLKPQRLMA
ncbi:hypothetical protein LY78DRAFT_666578 [Colletotrichum sublineola]|uniref:Putative PAP2 superfamily protein n=1 Tax=Colletotrichum sublineola TaxID=1173701 RepID=A0A066WUN1_COLSU|nr:hypothetical protein LY78DRAFT_666578 [Colletotrichum sublineola]KDN60387.1 putative PAP2 superfamily protein [Colletotrichum sublineola]